MFFRFFKEHKLFFFHIFFVILARKSLPNPNNSAICGSLIIKKAEGFMIIYLKRRKRFSNWTRILRSILFKTETTLYADLPKKLPKINCKSAWIVKRGNQMVQEECRGNTYWSPKVSPGSLHGTNLGLRIYLLRQLGPWLCRADLVPGSGRADMVPGSCRADPKS